MEDSPTDEWPPTAVEQGQVHVWRSAGSTEKLSPERALLSTSVVQVSLGDHHGLLLAQGGRVFSFGELPWRALSVPLSAPVLEASLLGKAVTFVAAGGFHCGALSEQGSVFMWGENASGQCGLTERGTVENITVPEPSLVSVVDTEVIPPKVVQVIQLACGREHSLALSAQNELWAWGSGCQLGLVTSTFPVKKPQKVEHLAGRHVIQVACGAYHSLALVRTLPPQVYKTQNSPKMRERGPSPHRPMSDREELLSSDDAHYCPLGVELKDEVKTEASPRRQVPKPKSHPGRKSTDGSPGSRTIFLSEDGLSDNRLRNVSIGSWPESEGCADSGFQTDSSPRAQQLWMSDKNFPVEELESQHTAQTGETDSLSSHTSDDSYVSSVLSSDLMTSSYKNDSAGKRYTSSSIGLSGLYSSSPLCLEEIHLSLQSLKSSSLTNIHEKGSSAASRRRSLPGTPTHGSPQRHRLCACRPLSGGRVQAAASEAAGDGLPSLETEVWSWGRGSEGQLGHGDQLARLQPLCVKSLTGQEVIKVAAGSHHSLALTAHCRVYSWGSNISGQLGHVNIPVTVPQQIKLSDGLHVWDLSGGQSHSLLLADSDCVQPVLLYCGQQQQPLPVKTAMLRSLSSCQRSPNRAESYTVRPTQLCLDIEMGYISSVRSGGQMCAVLMNHNIRGFTSAIHELASKERRLYCWLISVGRLLLFRLRDRQSVSLLLGEQCTQLFSTLCETFVRLSALAGRHSTSLNYFLHSGHIRDVTSLSLLTHTEFFQDTYKKYCSAVDDFQVMGGFQSLHNLSVECLATQQTTLAQLCGSNQSVGGEVDLGSVFYWPLQQLHQYHRTLLRLTACYDVSTIEYQSLNQGCAQYESLSLSLLKQKKEAETTFLFWKTHCGKATEGLRLPQRRVVCESSNRSLTPQNAGRFSSHWFILFNDVLVHAQFSIHRIYHLSWLWVKPITEDDTGLCAIKITCPEEVFTLVASSPQEKNKWLRSLNQAVDRALGGSGERSPGPAAMSRMASYTFAADERLRDAQYTGGWLAGRLHGSGTLKWPDGRLYKGNFKNGLEDGYGECTIPNKESNKPDSYQGQWKEGRIHGFGKYKYASGEVYEGCFWEGQRHGYGMLSSGKLTRTSSSMFIGHWVHGRKTGYGVFDDITRGQKYMGLWLDDQRHGNAIVISQHGVYFEGTFRENKMSGPGLLVSEDETTFHGEFSDDWTVSGKGVLFLANGDSLDGMFSGEWSSGLKVVGLYTRPATSESESKEKQTPKLGQYVVPATQRWSCIFDECWSRLGCDAAGRGDRATAWGNIAVTITTARRQSPNVSKSQSKLLESLEFIPQYAEPVTTANYDRIRRYLCKACETPYHPLGWLVETLVTAYRMTYVGSDRRLLQQAVAEVKVYLTHFYSIVRFLFSGLQEDGSVLPEPASHSSNSRSNSMNEWQSVLVVSCSSLLLPLLLPRLYPPLFELYCQQEEQEEAQYWQRIITFNKQPDQSLLSFLEVQEKFWPHWMLILGEKKQIVSSSKDACFVSAVETLQQISTTFTPGDKLLVIQETFKELKAEANLSLHRDVLWCMDDLLPLFMYVVIRARIRNLKAEVSLIEDLMDPNIQHGEMGLMFTTLQACYFQIQKESMT
ncbi:alsin-like isoform X3 [Oryzias latipes]|uniref:VPS9 domain-containing protein n=1 Tax=Oryzias latipes TaxID=8090 RepID=H2MKY3_ORYLA|nr:alsin-like isoform X3 [Oryzias latipes]